MENLIKKIDRAIEREILSSGKMGTEDVSIAIVLTDEEMIAWNNIDKYDNGHYYWEFDGNMLHISYFEDI